MKSHLTDTGGRFIYDCHCVFCVNNEVHPIKEYGEQPLEKIIINVLPEGDNVN